MSSMGGLAETAGTAEHVGEGHLLGGPQPLRLGVGVGCDDVHADHRIGLGELLRRFEMRPIDVERLQQHFRREMRGEAIGQPKHGGELGAVIAGAENP